MNKTKYLAEELGLKKEILKESLSIEEKNEARNILENSFLPFNDTHYGSLGSALGLLQGCYNLFHFFHWTTKGKQYYSDHLLYQRIYDELALQVDQLAEKSVGAAGPNVVNPTKTAAVSLELSKKTSEKQMSFGLEEGAGQGIAKTANWLLGVLLYSMNYIYNDLKQKNAMSPGLDNLLAGLIDKQEEFAYLLKMRVGK